MLLDAADAHDAADRTGFADADDVAGAADVADVVYVAVVSAGVFDVASAALAVADVACSC